MTDNGSDPVGRLLRDGAGRVAAQVTAPDWRSVVERHAQRRRRQRVHRVMAAAAATVIAVAVAVAITVQPGTGRQRAGAVGYPVRFGKRVFVVRDLLTAQRAAQVLGSPHIKARRLHVATPNYASIAFGAGSVWVLTYPVSGKATSACGNLVRVSAATAAVTGTVPIRLCPDGVAYGKGSVWVLSFQINVRGYQLVRVNPATLAIESITRIDAGPHGVIPSGDTGAKYMFVTVTRSLVFTAVQDSMGTSQIVAIDADTGKALTKLTLSPAEGPVTALGANHDAVWVGTDNGWVLGLDPATGTVKIARRVGVRVISLSASDHGVWLTVNLPVPPRLSLSVPGLDVLRLDPTTGVVAEDIGLPMAFVATDGTSVWALSSAPPYSSDAGLVARVNPATGAIIQRAGLPTRLSYESPDTLGVYRGSAWVINEFLRTLTRVTP